MSWLDKLLVAVPGGASTARLMGARLLGYPPALARLMGHREADVEHLLHGLLGMVDLESALVARGVVPDDATAVLEQLLQEKPCVARGEQPPLPLPIARRLGAVVELVLPKGPTGALAITSVDVIRACAAALPGELAFLRKPLEGAAIEVGPLFDGALATKDGVVSLEAWDSLSGAAIYGSVRLVEHFRGGIARPAHVLLALLSLTEVRASLTARGIDPSATVKNFGASIPSTWWTAHPLTEGDNIVSPGLLAVWLRTERYAADDASNVRLRHLLAALHDEPALAPFIETIAG